MAMAEAKRMSVPEGGLASFLTSNLDEIDDNVLAFGRPAGINSMSEVANRMAQMGRGGDSFVVHASEREMMVPREVVENNPALRRQIMESIAAEGGDPEAYVIGSDANSINPMTGQREFRFKKMVRRIKKAVKAVVKVVKKIAPIVLPIIGTMVLGPIYGAAAGSAAATAIRGGSVKDVLKSAVIGGVTGGITAGISGAYQGVQSGIGALPGAKAALSAAISPTNVFSNLGSRIAERGIFNAYQGPDYAALAQSKAAATAEAAQAAQGAGGVQPAVAQGGTGGANVVDKNAIENTLKQVVADDRTLLQRAKDILIKPNASQGEIVAEAGRIKADALLKGITLSSEMAINMATNALNPGLISKYGGLALAGGALAAAGGAFTPPPQEDITDTVFQPPTQEELDAVSVFPDGVPDPVQYVPSDLLIAPPDQYVPSDLLIAPPVQYRPEDLLQQASFAPAPNYFEITPPPPFQPIQFAGMNSQDFMQQGQIQGGQNFGFDRFGNPIQSVYAAAEGGAINGFPRRSGFISGPGTETSDSIPAMLSDGEFVMTAQAVRGLGGGSREKGVRKMYDMMRMFEGGAVT
jgi:hypothetical protein